MRLCGSNNFKILPEELCVLIFKNLNTKDLFKIQEVNMHFHFIFQKYFKKLKQGEIKEYIKNLTWLWVDIKKTLSDTGCLRLPKNNFLKSIMVELIGEIAPFYLFSEGEFYEQLMTQIRNSRRKKNIGMLKKIKSFNNIFNTNFIVHFLKKSDRKNSIIVIEGNNYTLIDIPEIDSNNFNEQCKEYKLNAHKQIYSVYNLNKTDIPILILCNLATKNINLNFYPKKYGNDEIVMIQARYYSLFMNNSDNILEEEIANYIDKNKFLLTHMLCGYANQKHPHQTMLPFVNQSYGAKIGLKKIQSMPWYKKMSECKENFLLNLIKNIKYCTKICEPKNQKEFCNPMKYFFPEFQKTVDPRAWFLYLSELEGQKENPVIKNLLNDKQFAPLIIWLKNEHKKDIEKHGFDIQKQLNNYLKKS